MDREAWHAVIHGVAKGRTWLSNWTELRQFYNHLTKLQTAGYFNWWNNYGSQFQLLSRVCIFAISFFALNMLLQTFSLHNQLAVKKFLVKDKTTGWQFGGWQFGFNCNISYHNLQLVMLLMALLNWLLTLKHTTSQEKEALRVSKVHSWTICAIEFWNIYQWTYYNTPEKKNSIESLTKQYRAQLQICILVFVNQHFS